MPKNLNAFKTGMFATASHLLPWENPEQYEALLANLLTELQPGNFLELMHVRNLAENIWQQEHLRFTTNLATHRHPCGRALAQARSPAELIEKLEKIRTEQNAEVKRLYEPLRKTAIAAAQLQANAESDDQEEITHRIAAVCEQALETLARVEQGLDPVNDFCREFFADHHERRIKIENARYAQYDKIRGRLVAEQDARAQREKLAAAAPQPQPADAKFDPGSLEKLLGDLLPGEKEEEVDLDADDDYVKPEGRSASKHIDPNAGDEGEAEKGEDSTNGDDDDDWDPNLGDEGEAEKGEDSTNGDDDDDWK